MATIEISYDPQLFLDDHLVAEMVNLKRQLHQPTRHPSNPLIVPEHPWEQQLISLYGTVLCEPPAGKFRCWYLASGSREKIPDTPEGPGLAKYYVCYAESEDGIHWAKPMVGQGRLGPYAKHNIVIPDGHGICVMKTPGDRNPKRLYKAAGGNVFGFSLDGIHWSMNDWDDAVGKNDTGMSVVWWKGRYLAFVRNQHPDPNWPGVMRAVGICTSNDFERWTRKETVFPTDAKDGYPWTQPYGLCVTAYGGVLIGLLPLLHLERNEGNNSLGDMDVQLLASRDGRTWQRVADRALFMPQHLAGPPAERPWDMRAYPSSTLLVKDDLIYIYYTGSNCRHGEGKVNPDGPWKQAIGLATLRRDGFVSLNAGDAEGTLVTQPLGFTGKTLHVNAEVASGGSLRAAFLLADGRREVEGFSADDCRAITRGGIDVPLSWRSGADVRAMSKSDVRIQFKLGNAKLYSFWIN